MERIIILKNTDAGQVHAVRLRSHPRPGAGYWRRKQRKQHEQHKE